MVAAGLGRRKGTGGFFEAPRGPETPLAEEGVKLLLEAGADINAVNEADFTALHGAAFVGLNEVIKHLVKQGANIDAQQYKGQTAFRLAAGSGEFVWVAYPGTAELLATLGADTALGIDGETLLRRREADDSFDPEEQQG